MVFETIYNLVLKLFHPLGFLEPVPLCKEKGAGHYGSDAEKGGQGSRSGAGREGGH